MEKVMVFVTMVVDAAENEVVREEAEALAAVVGEEVDAAAEDAGLLEEAVAAMVREEAVVGDDAVPATAMDGNLCWT